MTPSPLMPTARQTPRLRSSPRQYVISTIPVHPRIPRHHAAISPGHTPPFEDVTNTTVYHTPTPSLIMTQTCRHAAQRKQLEHAARDAAAPLTKGTINYATVATPNNLNTHCRQPTSRHLNAVTTSSPIVRATAQQAFDCSRNTVSLSPRHHYSRSP